jgi:hypothetical protein
LFGEQDTAPSGYSKIDRWVWQKEARIK